MLNMNLATIVHGEKVFYANHNTESTKLKEGHQVLLDFAF